MSSTNAVEIAPVAESLVELWAQPRRHWLRKREPRLAHVRDARKKILAYIAKPFHMLVAGSFADIDDGAPLSVVLQPYYAVIEVLRARSSARAAAKGQPWELRYALISARETDAEAKLTKVQMKVAANPNDLAALLEKRIAMREYRGILDEMEALIDERLSAQTPAA